MPRKHIAAILAIAVMCAAASAGQDLPKAKVYIQGAVFDVEVAGTPETRNRGLMNRDQLCSNCGMLFVFSEPRYVSFWMKDTTLPLSIAFIGSNGVIVDIQDMQPLTTESHRSRSPALYALEVNLGAFAEHGIEPGHSVRIIREDGSAWPQ